MDRRAIPNETFSRGGPEECPMRDERQIVISVVATKGPSIEMAVKVDDSDWAVDFVQCTEDWEDLLGLKFERDDFHGKVWTR